MRKKLLISCTAVICLVFCLIVPIYLMSKRPLSPSDSSSVQESNATESGRTPADYDALEALLLCNDRVKQAESFSAHQSGTCDIQVLFFQLRQNLSAERTVTSDAFFSQSIREGSLLRAGVQEYITDEGILVRGGDVYALDQVVWSDLPVAVKRDTYTDACGSASVGLSHFLLNEETVLASDLVSSAENTYTFTYTLNPQTATADYCKRLQSLCALEQKPTFRSVKLTVTMDETFWPISVAYEEEYTISIAILGETVCKSSYTETFSACGQATELTERDFFSAYLSLDAQTTFPELSGGYNLLFSLFDNSNSYNVTLKTGDTTVPMHLSMDAATASIYLQGNDFSFVYDDDCYYFSLGGNSVRTDAETFNRQVLPFSEISSALSETIGGTDGSSLLDGLQFETSGGKILLHAGDSTQGFSASIDMASHTLLSAELTLSSFSLSVEKSPVKATLPVLSDYRDITDSVSALSFFGEWCGGGVFPYDLEIEGDVSLAATAVLSVRDELSFSLVAQSGQIPLSLYYSDGVLTAVWDELSAVGSFSEYLACLEQFQNSATGGTNGFEIGQFVLSDQPDELTLRFGDGLSNELSLTSTCLQYTSDTFSVRLKKSDESNAVVKKPPETALHLSVAELGAFLDGSVYPALLSAQAVGCDVSAALNGTAFLGRATVSLSPSVSLGFTTVWEGNDIGLVYADDTAYLSTPYFDAFAPADRLQLIVDRLQALTGEQTFSAVGTGENDLKITALTCSDEQLTVMLGDCELIFFKESLQIKATNADIYCSDFLCYEQSVSIAHPKKETCIDLERLSERVLSLAEQTQYSFVGKYVSDELSADISRLDFRLKNDGTLRDGVIAFLLEDLSPHTYRILYDGEALYLDSDGIKLFALAEQLEEAFAGHESSGNDSLQFDLSKLRSITFESDVLTVELSDGLLTVCWENGKAEQILYRSKTQKLTLERSVYAPIAKPALEEYTDISAIGGLISAALKTAEQETFEIKGKLDLSLLSQSLKDMNFTGAFDFSSGQGKGYLSVEVPYLRGITSANIPLFQGIRLLNSCTISSQVFMEGDLLYFCRTVDATYGFYQQKTVTFTEKRYQTVDEFLQSPEQALIFLFNLESDLIADGSETDETDHAVLNPLKRFVNKGNLYTLELNPDAVFPAADSISVSAETDGTYLVGLNAELDFSVFALSLSGTLTELGTADLSVLEAQNFSEYLQGETFCTTMHN